MPSTATTATICSPLGLLRLRVTAEAVCSLDLPGPAIDSTKIEPPDSVDQLPLLRKAARQLSEYFNGQRRHFDLPIEPQGTTFQRAVWLALRTIPYGQTCSYAQLAARLGRPTAARAVGAANGRNPLPILLPCHRVIGADGRLTGYAGGLAAKQTLLDLERPDRPLFKIDPVNL